MKKRVLLCGNIAFDLIACSPRDKADPPSFTTRPGGSVLNTAILARRLGLNCSILAKTGRDFLSDTLLNIVRKEGINPQFIQRDASLKTALAFANIDSKGDSSYLFYKPSGKKTAFSRNTLHRNIFENCGIFHAASIFSYADHTFDNVMFLLKEAKKRGLITSFDPNWRESRIPDRAKAQKRIRNILKYVDIAKGSLEDLKHITGKEDTDKALRSLPGNFFVTLGAEGAFFFERLRGKIIRSQAYKVPVKDTIGAGDAFTAGLLAQLAEKGKEGFWNNIPRTLSFAQAVSAIVCTGCGATESLENTRQVKTFMEKSGRSGLQHHYRGE